jgi:hypothetical protein
MRKSKVKAVIRPLPIDDPRNLNHPCHDEQWKALAEALGRQIAREEFARDQEKRRAAAVMPPTSTGPDR